MSLKTINENPLITDEILFVLNTTDINGCLVNVYEINSVIIYFIERDYFSNKNNQIDNNVSDQVLQQQINSLKQQICQTVQPTPQQIQQLQQLQSQLANAAVANTTYFNQAVATTTLGTNDTSAWLSTNTEVSQITQILFDPNNNPLVGTFNYIWTPDSVAREGDYIICWTWTQNMNGSSLSNFLTFNVSGNTAVTTSIPTHVTNPNKYYDLLGRYTPQMFKMALNPNDLSPDVIQGFNDSVADGFTLMENLTNQIVDLQDANVLSPPLLPYLANLFGLTLRSQDITLQRRQIKQAVATFKQKGTLPGLTSALSQAGISLLDFNQLWQVTSNYTYQESFTATTAGVNTFTLSKTPVTPVDSNFVLSYRLFNSMTYDPINISNISFSGNTFIWTGLPLNAGDTLLLTYKINVIPNPYDQSLENYIRSLPLYDQRDERKQVYPLKNWNTRVIEEKDALFDVIVKVKNPYQDPVVFGDVRTEFPYSENIYNMDEYNGSTRQSTLPCDIGREFIDPCQSCLGSEFTVDLGIQNLCDDRITEAQEIITEYSPFHAVLHSMNLTGNFEDFVIPPVETIDALVQYEGTEITTMTQMIFNRVMDPNSQFTRSSLATVRSDILGNAIPESSGVGIGSSNNINIYCPGIDLNDFGLYLSNYQFNFLEVLSPSPNQGTYSINNINNNYANVSNQGVIGPLTTPVEPLNQSAFTFRLSAEVFRKTVNIVQLHTFKITDSTNNFLTLDLTTQEDINNGSLNPISTVFIPGWGGPYHILELTQDGGLILLNSGTLPLSNHTNVQYSVSNGATVVFSSINGDYFVQFTGMIDVSGGSALIKGEYIPVSDLTNIQEVINFGFYIYTPTHQYKVIGFVPNQNYQLIIDGYNSGNINGVSIIAYNRFVSNGTGYFGYSGMTLTTIINYESTLGILNGSNPPLDPTQILEDNRFKENFLILIDTNYYSILNINDTIINIGGPSTNWPTTGINVNYSIFRFEKVSKNIPERVSPAWPGASFYQIDRRGPETFNINIQDGMGFSALAYSLNKANSGEFVDTVRQKESIEFTIEWKVEK